MNEAHEIARWHDDGGRPHEDDDGPPREERPSALALVDGLCAQWERNGPPLPPDARYLLRRLVRRIVLRATASPRRRAELLCGAGEALCPTCLGEGCRACGMHGALPCLTGPARPCPTRAEGGHAWASS